VPYRHQSAFLHLGGGDIGSSHAQKVTLTQEVTADISRREHA
jgi:hypothetical protein